MDIEDTSTMLETAPEAAKQYRARQRLVDTVTLEIIRGKLLALADEMGIVLARTAMSPVIYEVLDFACGFCDPDGQLVAQTNGITVFTGTFALHVDVMRRKYAGQIRPGDIYMSNNPYEGGTHLNDVAIIKPTFVNDELLGFAISIAHWTDVGGKMAGSLPADATEIYQEGIRFTGVRLYRRANDRTICSRPSRRTSACRRCRSAISTRNWRRYESRTAGCRSCARNTAAPRCARLPPYYRDQ